MKKFLIAWLTVVLLTLSFTASLALAQTPPPPTVPFDSTFTATKQPREFDLVQRIVDFAPGSATVLHSHGGPQFVTVLEGAVTLRIAGTEKTYKPGETWVEQAGEQHLGSNNGATKARVLASLLLPPGAAQTTNVEAATKPAPTIAFESTFKVTNQPGDFDLIQRIVDFAPGAATVLHYHGGPQYVTVLEGEVTLQMAGTTRTYKPGETWIEPARERHMGSNLSKAPARVMATMLLPKGTPATTNLDTAPQVMPTTGGRALPVYSYAWLLIGLSALVLGVGLRWRSSS